MRLNHLDLPVPDVAATAAFFTEYLGFRQLDMRGKDALAILQDESGFVLVLNRAPAAEPLQFPGWFHIGFLLESDEAVHATHARLQRAGLADLPAAPSVMRGALLFYFHAPGGIMVEVSHRSEQKRE